MKEQRNYLPHIIVYAVCILASMFNYADFELMSFSASLPIIDLIVVFYFNVYRRFVSIWLILLMGMISDSMSGTPLGVTSLSYILVLKLFHLVEIKKVSAEEFLYIVRKFSIFIICLLSLKSLILVAINDLAVNLFYLLFQVVITVFVYVLCHKAFDDFYKKYFFEK